MQTIILETSIAEQVVCASFFEDLLKKLLETMSINGVIPSIEEFILHEVTHTELPSGIATTVLFIYKKDNQLVHILIHDLVRDTHRTIQSILVVSEGVSLRGIDYDNTVQKLLKPTDE